MTGLARFIATLRDHPDKPSPGQCWALVVLASRLDWKDGTGYASVTRVGADAGCDDRTVKRSLAWARTAGLLEQTQRGGHRGDKAVASEWRLSQGDSGDTLGNSERVAPEIPKVTDEAPQGDSGVTPSVPVSIKAEKPKAECPDCHAKVSIRADGRLQVHGPRSHRCIGSGFVADEHAWANRKYQGLPVRPGELVKSISHRGGAVSRNELAQVHIVTRSQLDLVIAVAVKRRLVDVAGEYVLTPGPRGEAKTSRPAADASTARCPVCLRDTKLKPNGVLWPHGDRYMPCLGSETQPALPASAVQASAAIGQIIAADPGIISPPKETQP